ncbi:MAG: hypothetical protein II028_09430, partial [Clostridia bacterium]|nr:hypothetical protein [Clostridia bacterium]
MVYKFQFMHHITARVLLSAAVGSGNKNDFTVCKVMLRICKLDVVVLADTSKYNEIIKHTGGFRDDDLRQAGS